MMRWFLCIGLCLAVQLPCGAQQKTHDELAQTIKSNDSLLFEVGFNRCDLRPFELLVSNNFEFYHDQSGITRSKSTFVASIKNGLCKLDYQAKRVLVDSSLEIYPLMNAAELYGAIQSGIHHFYALEPGKAARLTSTAKFTHVWLLENGQWKLARGLSFDHVTPE